MPFTKREVCTEAFTEIGLATFNFDVGPDQYQAAAQRLDSMMAEWNARGIKLAYPLPSGPGSGSLDDPTNAPDSAWQAMVTNLAVRIAPMFGKTPMPATLAAAKHALNTLMGLFAAPVEIQLRTLPAGAGNKPWRYGQPYLNPPVQPLLSGPEGPLDLD